MAPSMEVAGWTLILETSETFSVVKCQMKYNSNICRALASAA